MGEVFGHSVPCLCRRAFGGVFVHARSCIAHYITLLYVLCMALKKQLRERSLDSRRLAAEQQPIMWYVAVEQQLHGGLGSWRSGRKLQVIAIG